MGTGCGVGGTNCVVSGGATTLTIPGTGTGVPGGVSGLREGGVGGWARTGSGFGPSIGVLGKAAGTVVTGGLVAGCWRRSNIDQLVNIGSAPTTHTFLTQNLDCVTHTVIHL